MKRKEQSRVVRSKEEQFIERLMSAIVDMGKESPRGPKVKAKPATPKGPGNVIYVDFPGLMAAKDKKRSEVAPKSTKSA